MRNLVRVVSLVSLGLSCSVASCAESSEKPEENSTSDATGSIGLSLTTSSGLTLDAFTYNIVGPNGFLRSATVDISHASKLSTLVSGLPAGNGYSVTISSVTADQTSCGGVATFNIVGRATSNVTVHLQCREPAKTGSVLVNGELNACAAIDGIGASPAEAFVGSSLQLSATAHDADQAPAALAYQWTASSGTLAGANTSSPTLTCATVGNVTVTLNVADGDCGDTQTATVTCSAPVDPVVRVFPTIETTPVPDTGDAADDPAIWVNPADAAQSLIIGTDKQAGGGLGVYGLDGVQLQYVPFGKLNNVDLRDGFVLGGVPTTLVTAGNRSDNTIAIFKLDAATRTLSDAAARKITTLTTYGSCMYKSPVSGKFYYFVDSKEGNIEQWELFDNAGKVDAVKVRDLHQLSSQPEACAVDDEAKALFVGEEAKGVWKFDAEPNVTSGAGWEGVLIASTDPGGHLVRDVEGVAISKTGATSGYIYVSNQGESTYSVFTREAPHSYVKTFRIERGAACVDGVTGSDGIEASGANLGPAFPNGVFVTQDDSNDGSNQNFKLVPLQQILGQAPVVDDQACSGSGGSGGSSGSAGASGAGGSGGAAVGYGEPFCTTFCDKCASCYATGTFSEGDCVYQQPKTAFTLADCKAGCALSSTPGAAAKTALAPGFESLTCTAFDDAM